MDVQHYFSSDYRAARSKFREAAASAGFELESFENPTPAPDGDSLYADVAFWGDEQSERALLANSATHGVEGFCGSGVMVGWLRSGGYRHVPPGIRVVLVHAVNPFGFAWLRRVNEDNVDLNRNFVDHSGVYPDNVDYAELHPWIVPQSWDQDTVAECDMQLREYAAQHGAFALQAAMSGGQYAFPDGVFYGGRQPTWSNRIFCTILERFVSAARHVAFVDFHTGLGPYGHAELISQDSPDTPTGATVRSWYGEGVTSPAAGDSASAPLTGVIATAVRAVLHQAEVFSVTAEFGTYPVWEVMASLRADNWLHLHGELDSLLGREIKADIRRRFYPDEADWKELVFVRGRQVLNRAVRGLEGL